MRTRLNEDMLDWQRNLINDIIMPFTGSGFTDHVLQAPFSSNFVRYVEVTKGFHQSCHPIFQVTLVQFADQVQNDDKS